MGKMARLLVFIFLGVLSNARGIRYVVAEDNLGTTGQDVHLWEADGSYRYSEQEVSFSAVDEESPIRTLAHGARQVVLGYAGADEKARYVAELTFLSEQPGRILQVLVDGITVEEDFTLPPRQVVRQEVDIPAEATADGKFVVTVRKVQGANAVLSFVSVKSDVDRPLAAIPLLSTVPCPRISPIPSAVAGVADPEMNLDGVWKFNPAPKAGFGKQTATDDWHDIRVPGEWAMQGFHVEKDAAAGYFRTFTVPDDWKNSRIKLRFNAVYSDATVYVNGEEAGTHVGGFTLFELDVTDLVAFGRENTLALSVKNESVADSLASGSEYACHPLGGITRSVSLIALPKVNIASLAVQTTFDAQFKNATLTALVDVCNESSTDVSGLKVRFELSSWNGDEKVELRPSEVSVGKTGAGKTEKLEFSVLVLNPRKWDCENPNLYVLACRLEKDGRTMETLKQRFGFRQSEVVGNQLFINGVRVKLRGVNRHEVHPLTGRSIPREMYAKDMALFLEGNVNHIRTCHYPPDKALLDLADEMGMFIECEGPFCWAQNTTVDPSEIREATIRQSLEMVVAYRNHPSIIYWSLANESHWNKHFDLSAKAVAELDPTRPRTFNYFPWGPGVHREDEHICQIASDHYPGPGGPSKYMNHDRPVSFGEYAHLNAYNRYELATDAALRDLWGTYLHRMWEEMYAAKGCLGGSIWAGIDDTFYWDFKNSDGSVEQRTVGYGTWGPIDGWRRRKPEWWVMKKTYSPIRIRKVEIVGSKVVAQIENRQDFSNLNRLEAKWKLGGQSGTVSADVKPKSSGKLIISPKGTIDPAEHLELVFDDPRGFNVDRFNLPLGTNGDKAAPQKVNERYGVEKSTGKIVVSNSKVEYVIDRETGLFECPEFKGPYLMILPLNSGGDTQMHGPTQYYEPYTHTCTEWKLASIVTGTHGRSPTVTVSGSYKEATGSYTYTFNDDGTLTVDYDFVANEHVNPRQLGIVFEVPKSFARLSWKRKGYWSAYPDWHIARLEGTASAAEGVETTPVGPRHEPAHEWRHDRTKIGSHDFASTKHNIYSASLTDKTGHGLKVMANADMHARAWIEGETIRMLIAHYSNGGSERFLRGHAVLDDRPLKPGDEIRGAVVLKVNCRQIQDASK